MKRLVKQTTDLEKALGLIEEELEVHIHSSEVFVEKVDDVFWN